MYIQVGACIVNDSDEQVLAIGGSSGPRKGQETVDRLKKLIKSHGTSLHTSDTNSKCAPLIISYVHVRLYIYYI